MPTPCLCSRQLRCPRHDPLERGTVVTVTNDPRLDAGLTVTVLRYWRNGRWIVALPNHGGELAVDGQALVAT